MCRIVLGVLVAAASLFTAHAASFDCGRASTAVEGSICANATLSALDEQLATAYTQAVNASANPAALLDAQRAWLKTLNACGANVQCLTNTFEQRLTVLNPASSSNPVIAPSLPATTPTPQNQIALPNANAQTSTTGRSDQPKIQTVVVEGVGTDVQGAAQNAALNALTNVVGSFIDATSMIEKRTQIAEGIRTQTKDIKSNIKEYSQGNIQSFEILDTKNESGLLRVTAKVSIRIEDFRAYIKKLAEGETAVESGLFTRVTTQTTQKTNKLNLLTDLLKPLIEGEVIKFSIEKPLALTDSKYKGGHTNLDNLVREFGSENIFFVKVNAAIDPDFLINFRRTLEATAAGKTSIPDDAHTSSTSTCSLTQKFNPNLALGFLLSESAYQAPSDSASPAVYEEKRNDRRRLAEIFVVDDVFEGVMALFNKQLNDMLDVEILGSNGVVLQKESLSANTQKTKGITFYSENYYSQDSAPWRLTNAYSGIGGVCNLRALTIFEKRSFVFAISMDQAALKDAKKIVVRLVNSGGI